MARLWRNRYNGTKEMNQCYSWNFALSSVPEEMQMEIK
jgi:hypothetical protein